MDTFKENDQEVGVKQMLKNQHCGPESVIRVEKKERMVRKRESSWNP